MKVLFFIGNGFDIAYGLKTRYTDFYKFFIGHKDGDSDEVQKLKERISADYQTWADLEKALGEDTVNFESSVNFENVFYTTKDALQDYLIEVDNSFKVTQELASNAKKALCLRKIRWRRLI